MLLPLQLLFLRLLLIHDLPLRKIIIIIIKQLFINERWGCKVFSHTLFIVATPPKTSLQNVFEAPNITTKSTDKYSEKPRDSHLSKKNFFKGKRKIIERFTKSIRE